MTFPTFLFHPTLATEGQLFTSQQQVEAAGPGWVDTPAAFAKDYVPPPPPPEGQMVVSTPGGGSQVYVPQRFPAHLYNRQGEMTEFKSAEQFAREAGDPADWRDTPAPGAFTKPAAQGEPHVSTTQPDPSVFNSEAAQRVVDAGVKPVGVQTGPRVAVPDPPVVSFEKPNLSDDPLTREAAVVATAAGDASLRSTVEDQASRPAPPPMRARPTEAAVTLSDDQKKAFYAAPIDKVVKQLDGTQSPAMLDALLAAEQVNPAGTRKSVEKAIKARTRLLSAPSVDPLDTSAAGE